MPNINFYLNQEDYTWKRAFLWGNCIGHFKKVGTGNFGSKVVHTGIALIELFPIVSQVSSVVEKVIATKHFKPIQSSRNEAVFRQISVLNQTYQKRGNETCGFHAFKNALLGLGLTSNTTTTQMFKDKVLFESLYNFILQFQPEGEGDINIANLNRALLALKNSSKSDLPSELGLFYDLLQTHPDSVTMLNPQRGSISNGILDTNLNNLSNLVRLSAQEGPFIHSFILGRAEHWVTLIFEKKEDGTIIWYGCDSWNNDSSQFQQYIDLLEQIFQTPDQYVKPAFFEIVAGISRKAAWIDEIGIVNNIENYHALLAHKDIYCQRAIHIFKFMEDAGYLERTSEEDIQTFIEHLRRYALFFKLNIDPDKDADFYRQLNVMEKRLRNLIIT